MLAKRGLDLTRVNVLAAADDHVVTPVDDMQEVARVAVADVTGMEPAVDQRFRRFFRESPVPAHQPRSAQYDFARLSLSQQLAVFADDTELVSCRVAAR